jgi:hypothetical protein
MSKRITSSIAHQIQVQRKKWFWERLLLSDMPDQVVDSRKPWDSALTTIILLLSCGASLGSCFYLVTSISPGDATSWKSPLHVGYLITPCFTTAAGLSAMYLHGRGCTPKLDPAQVVNGAVASTSRLLYFILPISTLTSWTAHSGQEIMTLTGAQIAMLSVFVLLPVYVIHTGYDDW